MWDQPPLRLSQAAAHGRVAGLTVAPTGTHTRRLFRGRSALTARTAPHTGRMDIPAVTREAFVLLSNAAALRKVGRTADALAFAERAERRLAEVLDGVKELIAEMRAEPIPLTPAPDQDREAA